jgi:flagellar hook assembly protein FlgD
MSVSAVNPVRSAAASASAATGNAAASSSSKAFDEILQQVRGGEASATGGASGSAKASDDPTEDRFLKLLVAQMKNQDPLNPLDNAQVTSQLAQINTVKGIDKLNTALQKLVDRGESGTATEAAAMVGRRVLVEGSTMELPEEGVAQAGFELAAPASSVKIEVVGRNGAVVDTRTPKGMQDVYGGAYAAGSIYVPVEFSKKYPNTAQAIVNAMVRALRFIQASTPDQIVAAVPPEYYTDRALYKAAVEKNLDTWKHDGAISIEAGQNVTRDLKTFDPTVEKATIDVAKTVNMTFQQKAAQKYK